MATEFYNDTLNLDTSEDSVELSGSSAATRMDRRGKGCLALHNYMHVLHPRSITA